MKLKNTTFESPCLQRGPIWKCKKYEKYLSSNLFAPLQNFVWCKVKKKTSPFFIHCSFTCSILSWSIFEYLVSFLTDKIKFRIFFLDGINLFLWVCLTLNPPNIFSLTKYVTLHWIPFGVLHPSRICSLMQSATLSSIGWMILAASPV